LFDQRSVDFGERERGACKGLMAAVFAILGREKIIRERERGSWK